MSYILSALKKAEHHRQVGASPNLFSMQAEATEPDLSWKWLRVALSVLGVVVIAAFVGLLVSNWALLGRLHLSPESSPPATTAVIGKTTSQPTPAPTYAPQTTQTPPLLNADQKTDTATLREPITPSTVAIDIDRLDPSIRSQIPRFTISGYLYSAARPQANKVIINDIAMREGQYVSENLRLKEINARYIVMDYRGTLFRIAHDRLSDY